MVEDDIRQRESEYLDAANLRGRAEAQFSEEVLLAKTQDVTDKVAEHMATTRLGQALASARAMEYIARKRLDRASESTA